MNTLKLNVIEKLYVHEQKRRKSRSSTKRLLIQNKQND